jgi:transcriptional regulator with XRE-family HTH domain
MMYQSPQRIEGLREARLRAGLTQQRLADLSGLQRQHISAIELHRLLLTESRARKLAWHLGVHPAALVVGQAAVPILRGANKPSVGLEDFRALLRSYSATRAHDVVSPGLRLELIGVVRQLSDALFAGWYRLLEDAERDTERALEAEPS